MGYGPTDYKGRGMRSTTYSAFLVVSFINNVLLERMLPETIARASLLRRNRDICRSIADIAAEYNKKHPESCRRGHKRAITTTETIEV